MVLGAGLPMEFVAVVVAMLVLLPEATSSVRAAGTSGCRPASTWHWLGDRLRPD